MNLYTPLLKPIEDMLQRATAPDCCVILGELERIRVAALIRLTHQNGASEPAARPLLNAAQIADRLQLPKARVYELIRQGKLPAVRVGKYVRMEADRLDRWIAEQREA